MDAKLKGSICGIVAAISYGTNPLGALFLYDAGVNTDSVLFYRFSLAAILLGAWMLIQKTSFRVTRKELSVLGALGVLFATSSLTLFTSFYYMDAGVASTILFVYPIMVAVIMTIFFKERISLITVLSILLALGGIGLLYQGDNGSTLSSVGVLLVMPILSHVCSLHHCRKSIVIENVIYQINILCIVILHTDNRDPLPFR